MPFDIEKIRKSTRRVAKFLQKNAKRPRSNAVHKLRTATRLLETTFTTLDLNPNRKVKRLLRRLRGVRKRAGDIREMDVMTSDALTMKENGEHDCLVQLFEHLGTERKKYAKKLHAVIEAAGPELGRDLKQHSKRVERLLHRAENHAGDSDATPATMAKAIKLSSDLNEPTRLSRNTLHPYRLKVKELRDVLQLSGRTGDDEFFGKLGMVTDAIGEWHDWEELIAVARQLLNHGPSCRLIKQLKMISASKYERALSLTNQGRHYLKPTGRVKKAPLSNSVLRATS
jgi:CHAD domain-containing protein